MHGGLEKVMKSFLAHPVCTSKMAVMHALGPLRILVGVQSKNDGDGFAPVSPFGFSVKQANVFYQVLLIVWADAIQLRRAIFKVFKGRFGQRIYSLRPGLRLVLVQFQ